MATARQSRKGDYRTARIAPFHSSMHFPANKKDRGPKDSFKSDVYL